MATDKPDPFANERRRMAECLVQINAILLVNGGDESNVAIGSVYWSLVNEYRGLAMIVSGRRA